MNRAPSTPGRIAFVGSGPGDPGLLTVRARDALARRAARRHRPRRAGGVLALVADGAEVRPAVGAARRRRAGPGRRGAATAARVTRLVSGDPLTVDAVVQEALAVAAAGVPFDVVPGVPAGTAVPAYAGRAARLGARRGRRARRASTGPRLAAAPGPLVLHATAVAPARGGHRRSPSTASPRRPRSPSPSSGTPTTQKTVQATLATLAADARRPRGPAGASPSAPRSGCAPSCPGGSRGRCTAGGCWCRAPRTRPAR